MRLDRTDDEAVGSSAFLRGEGRQRVFICVCPDCGRDYPELAPDGAPKLRGCGCAINAENRRRREQKGHFVSEERRPAYAGHASR